MNKQQRLRCRIKQLEHQNKLLINQLAYGNCDMMRFSLVRVVNLYEAMCRENGWTESELKALRGDFINGVMEDA